MYENESCHTCTHCKYPGYLYCSKHHRRVDENECCEDYESPVAGLARIILEEDGVIPKHDDSSHSDHHNESGIDFGLIASVIVLIIFGCCFIDLLAAIAAWF